MSASTPETIEEILGREGDADAVLAEVVAVLVRDPAVTWAGIAFLENGELVLGPFAGRPQEEARTRTPISYQGELVGELRVDGEIDRGLLEGVADRLAPYVLIGWDTGGEPWEP